MGSESSESQDEFEEKPFKEKNELFDSQKSSNPSGIRYQVFYCIIAFETAMRQQNFAKQKLNRER